MASIGLAGAVAGTVLLTRAALQQIDALAKQSQLLGITTEKLAAFQLVAEKTGVEQKTLEKSLINVTRVVAEAAEGTGLATDTLKKLGLEAKALALLSPDEQFLQIADAMKGLNSQSEKVLASYELFGGRGAALLRTLEAGSAAFEEAEEKTKLYGTAISAVDAKSIEDANDAFTDMKEAIKGVGFDLARRFSPGMEAANKSTAGFLVTIRRDFIPAMALMLEQMNLVQNNVRGLSDIELLVRIELQADRLAEIEREAQLVQNAINAARMNELALGLDAEKIANREARDKRRTDSIAADRAEIEDRLASVKEEIARRAQFEIDAQTRLNEQKAAQEADAKAERIETDRLAEEEAFNHRLDVEIERADKLKALRDKVTANALKAAVTEAEAWKTAKDIQLKLEKRAAEQTIALRQATAQTSINILQVLVGKNKTVARALFLVEKGLAIARTVQNTAAAQVKALAELGPIAGPPAAAAIAAFGAAQVGLIAATALAGVGSISGGGSLAIGGGAYAGSDGGFGGGFDGGGGLAPNGGGTGLESQGVVQLIFPNVFGITPDAVDALAEALREASQNRDVIIVSGQGRNAELLQGANG